MPSTEHDYSQDNDDDDDDEDIDLIHNKKKKKNHHHHQSQSLPITRNVKLAFDFLDRLLELEHHQQHRGETALNDNDNTIDDNNNNNINNINQCLNAVMKIWREEYKNNNGSNNNLSVFKFWKNWIRIEILQVIFY